MKKVVSSRLLGKSVTISELRISSSPTSTHHDDKNNLGWCACHRLEEKIRKKITSFHPHTPLLNDALLHSVDRDFCNCEYLPLPPPTTCMKKNHVGMLPP